MLYRPKFCAECGEKIERAEWHLWTSGRFCELCASSRKGTELFARLAVGGGLFCIAGFVVLNLVAANGKTAAPLVPLRLAAANQPMNEVPVPAQGQRQPAETRPAAAPAASSPGNVQAGPAVINAQPAMPGVVDAVYICGAATKKGTPCSRRVHERVRCWQHTGMPAMLPDDKLRVR